LPLIKLFSANSNIPCELCGEKLLTAESAEYHGENAEKTKPIGKT
jgi:hypothetical protein